MKGKIVDPLFLSFFISEFNNDCEKIKKQKN